MLGKSYALKYPKVVAVFMTGMPKPWVGPMDVILSIIGEVFKNGFVKNCVLEFVGPGVENLSMDFRNGIDTMTTESTCLSSLWTTDAKTEEYFAIHGRPEDYKEMKPDDAALYDKVIEVNLDTIEPVIALPFHPSNVYSLKEIIADPKEALSIIDKMPSAPLKITLTSIGTLPERSMTTASSMLTRASSQAAVLVLLKTSMPSARWLNI